MTRKTWSGRRTRYFENNLYNAFGSLSALVKGVIYYCESAQSFNLAANMVIAQKVVQLSSSNNHTFTQNNILSLGASNSLRAFAGPGGGSGTNNRYLSDRSVSRLFTYIEKIAYTGRKASIIGIVITMHVSYAIISHLWDSSDQSMNQYLSNNVNSTNIAERNLIQNSASQGFSWTVMLWPMVNLTVYYGTSLLDRVIKKYCNELPLIEIPDGVKENDTLINPLWGGDLSTLKKNGNTPKSISDFNLKKQERIKQYIDSGNFTPVESDNGILDHNFSRRSLIIRFGLGIGCFGLSIGAYGLLNVLKNNPSNALMLYIAKHLLIAIQGLNGAYVVLMRLVKPIIEKPLTRYVTDRYITPNKKISGTVQHLRAIGITSVSLALSYLFYGSARLVADEVSFFGIPSISNSAFRECIFQLVLGVGILFENLTVFNSLLSIIERSHVFVCDDIEFANDNILEDKMNSLRRRGNISIMISFVLTTLESAQLITLSYMNLEQRGSLLNYHMNSVRMLISGTTNVLCLLIGNRLLVNSQLIENELNRRAIVRGNNKYESTEVLSDSNISTTMNVVDDNSTLNAESDNLLRVNNKIKVLNANQIFVSLPNLGEFSGGNENYQRFIGSIKIANRR